MSSSSSALRPPRSEEETLDLAISEGEVLSLVDLPTSPVASETVFEPPSPEPPSSEMGRRPNLARLYSSTSSTKEASPKAWSIRSIAFGSFCAPGTFAGEWEREGRGVDRLFLETRKRDAVKQLVVRMWDAPEGLEMEMGTASIRITVEIHTIDALESSSGGTSLFLRLSRPPLLERLDAQLPGGLKPLARQVGSFDDDHARVAGYSGRVLRIKLRTRQDFEAFRLQADEAGLPRVVASKIEAAASTRYSATTLARVQSWLLTLDIRIAFQLEKLVRNGLVDPVKLLALRERIEELVGSTSAGRAESMLARFADELTEEKRPDEVEELVLSEDEKENSAVRPAKRIKRRRDSFSSALSSGEEDEASSFQAAPFAGARSLFASSSELSISELVNRLTRAASSASLDPFLSAADPARLSRQVAITPTRILLSGPFLADSNSVTRSYGQPEHFISVSVRGEDGSRLRDKDGDLVESRFKPLFRNGLDLVGRTFLFLAFSSSAMKSGTCFFMSPFIHEDVLVTPQVVHVGLGDFSGTETAKVPAKFSARIAQAFSSSKPSLTLEPTHILSIPDLISPSGSVFSDGVGTISISLAAQVVEALVLKLQPKQLHPTCFQFRMGGAKGMLQVDPSLQGRVVGLRPSQVKFRSSLTTLEIAGVFTGAGRGYLNRPLIVLLEDLGVSADKLLKLQNKATRSIRKSRASLRSAIKLVKDWDVASSPHLVSTLSFLANDTAASAAAFSSPFVSSCLDAVVSHALREIKHSGRIPVPESYNLVGVLDLDGVLAPGEIYARLQHEDGSIEYVEGSVAVSRSPTNHPGDLRLVKAVGRLPKGVGERIRGLVNCVVFSSQGDRSLPSMLAGGDLDGDVYLLLTEKSGLLPSPDRIAEPAAYDPSPTVKLEGREAGVEDVADLFFQYNMHDRTGLVATRQLHLADAHPDGLFSLDCLRLAQLHSDCVDAAKSGHFVYADEIPRPPLRGWPDFLTNDGPDSYRSPKALGQLFRAIGEDMFDELRPKEKLDKDEGAVDPLRQLTSALERLILAALGRQSLPATPTAFKPHLVTLLSSFTHEFSKLASSSAQALPSPSSGSGGPKKLTEEELFLSVTLGARRLDKTDKLALNRRREQVGELFSLAKRLIRQGSTAAGGGTDVSAKEGVENAWVAWMAAVQEGEDRAKRAKKGGGSGQLGLRSFAWLALGVLVEQLDVVEKEKVEVIVLD